jgi:hypothetical protein
MIQIIKRIQTQSEKREIMEEVRGGLLLTSTRKSYQLHTESIVS